MSTTAPVSAADELSHRTAEPKFSPRQYLESQPRWALIVRGIAGILLGLTAFLMPGLTFVMLIGLFAGYMLVDGVFAIISGVKAGRGGERWWPFILEGIANLGVAAIALILPAATGLALVYLVAVWAIFTGVMLMIPNKGQATSTRVLMALAGLASILLGIAMIVQPIAGSLAVVWMVGMYGLAFGTLLLAAGLKGRRAVTATPPPTV
jgi:uncharacterized membrane protein HdeD (DUF308 family)